MATAKHTTPKHPCQLVAAVEVANLPLLLLRREVAAIARCSLRSVERADARGELKPVPRKRDGSARVLYARVEVLRWLGLQVSA